MNRPLNQMIRPRILILVAMLAFLGLALQFQSFFIDDSYITYRYADVWNRSGNLSFNVEDTDPVDGFTSFLWVCLSAVFLKANLNPLLGTKVMGVLSGFIALLLLYAVGTRLGYRKWLVAGGVLLVALSSETAMWANSGMETASFSFLLLAGIYLLLRDLDREQNPISWIVFAILCLTRPEGMAFSGLAWISYSAFLVHRHGPGAALTRSLVWLFGFVLTFGSYFLWHWSYYGYPFSNSYYAKAIPGGGILYLKMFITAFAPLHLLMLVSTAVVILERNAKRITIALFILGVVLANLTAIGGINPAMAWDHRLLLHLVPLLMLASYPVFDRFMITGRRALIGVSIALLAGTIVYTTRPDKYAIRIESARVSSSQIRKTHFGLGEWMLDNIPTGTVMATIDTGVIPYLSRGHFVDIANVPLNNKSFVHGTESLEAIWDLKPKAFVLAGINPNSIQYDRVRAPLVSEASDRGWKIVTRLQHREDYYLLVYMDPSLAQSIADKRSASQ